MLGLLRRIYHRIFKTESDLERACRLGFKHGKNFICFSPYAIDANWPWLISCGDDVEISTNVTILAHDASPCKAGVSTKVGRVRIGNNVFIGARSVILCNVRIGDNVIIGAGSVVTHDVPSNSIYAGNPARLVSTFEEYKAKHEKNHQNVPICNEYRWDLWPDAPEAARVNQSEQLEKSFGYLT